MSFFSNNVKYHAKKSKKDNFTLLIVIGVIAIIWVGIMIAGGLASGILKSMIIPIILVLGFFGIIAALAGYAYRSASQQFLDPLRGPIVKKLLKQFGSPEQIANEIDREMAEPHWQKQWVLSNKWEDDELLRNSIPITRNWFIYVGFDLSINLRRLYDIVWMYQLKTTYHPQHGTVQFFYDLMIIDKTEKVLEIHIPQDDILQVLVILSNRLPWVKVGFTDELVDAWKTDINTFIEDVEQKQREYGLVK